MFSEAVQSVAGLPGRWPQRSSADQLWRAARLGEPAGPGVRAARQVRRGRIQRRPGSLVADSPITLVTTLVARSAIALPLCPCRFVRDQPGCAAGGPCNRRNRRRSAGAGARDEQQVGELALGVCRPGRMVLRCQSGRRSRSALPVDLGLHATPSESGDRAAAAGPVSANGPRWLVPSCSSTPPRSGRGAGHHPSVVDQDVDRIGPGGRERPHGVQVGQVQLPCLGPASRSGDGVGRLRLVAGGDHDPASLVGQDLGSGGADAALVAPVMSTVGALSWAGRESVDQRVIHPRYVGPDHLLVLPATVTLGLQS